MLALDCWNGTPSSVQNFLVATGFTFPMLVQAGFVQTLWGIAYDNYVLVDKDGIVRYTSVGETFGALGRFHDGHLRAAIRAWLPLPVESPSWGAVKEMYR
jgi:hypothetical protein